MKKVIIVIFILLSYTTFSQTTDSTENKNTLLVSYSPFPLIVKQYTVNFEYIFSEQFSISLDLGKANALYDSYSIIPIFIYDSKIFRANLLFLENHRKKFHYYYGPGVIFKQIWNNNVVYDPCRYTWGICDSHNYYYQKRNGFAIGLQYTQGWRWFFGPLTISPFYRGGMVVRLETINTYAERSAYSSQIYYYKKNSYRNSYFPSFEIESGVRFGLNYRFKKR